MREGWVETTLGEVAEWWSGGTPKAREPKYYENGTIPWAVIADMNKGIIYSTNSYITEEALELIGGRLAPAGSVLISMYASVGKSAIANIPLATNQAIAWSIPNQKKIIPFYLYLVAQQLEKEISDLARGATQRNINRQMLREFTFQLPPLLEQKRIVDLISSVDSYIEALEQQLETATRSRNAVLHELLTAGGEDWVEKTLDLVTECSWGNTETTKSKYVDSGFLAYSASGADGFLDWFEHDRTAVVLSAIGAQCGKTWFAEGKWTSIKNTIWLKADNLNLLDKYLFYLSNRDQFWQIRGQAQPFISLGDVKKTKVLLPPLVEQERIIQVISGLDSFQDSMSACLNSSKNLRAGMLSSLLSSEHEIPTSYDKIMGAA